MELVASSEFPTRIFAPSGKGYTSTKQKMLARNPRTATNKANGKRGSTQSTACRGNHLPLINTQSMPTG